MAVSEPVYFLGVLILIDGDDVLLDLLGGVDPVFPDVDVLELVCSAPKLVKLFFGYFAVVAAHCW